MEDCCENKIMLIHVKYLEQNLVCGKWPINVKIIILLFFHLMTFS